jgi:hypothetical protein
MMTTVERPTGDTRGRARQRGLMLHDIRVCDPVPSDGRCRRRQFTMTDHDPSVMTNLMPGDDTPNACVPAGLIDTEHMFPPLRPGTTTNSRCKARSQGRRGPRTLRMLMRLPTARPPKTDWTSIRYTGSRHLGNLAAPMGRRHQYFSGFVSRTGAAVTRPVQGPGGDLDRRPNPALRV